MIGCIYFTHWYSMLSTTFILFPVIEIIIKPKFSFIYLFYMFFFMLNSLYLHFWVFVLIHPYCFILIRITIYIIW